MRNAAGKPLGSIKASREKIGPCFGYNTSLSQPTNGSRIWVRCDVFGGVQKSTADATWNPVVTALTIPSADQHDDGGYSTYTDRPGVTEMICAPSNGDIALMQWDGWTYLTKDALATAWVKMGIPRKTLLQNGNDSRIYGRYIAIHPTDPNKAVVGTQGQDCYYTTNMLATTPTWTAIGIPASANEPGGKGPMQHICLINPVNANEVFINCWGTGWYKSTTGVAGPYSLMSGTSTYKATRAKFDDLGALWFIQYGAVNNVYRLDNGASSFTNMSTGGRQFGDVAIDPTNTNRMFAVLIDNTFLRSTDRGVTWPDVWSGDITSNPPRQLVRAKTGKAFDAGTSRQWSPNPSTIEYNRAVAGEILCTHGFGFHRTTLPASSTNPIVWVEDAEDIPMLVTQCGVFTNDIAIYGAHDVGTITVTDPTRYVNIRDNPPNSRDEPQLVPPILVQPCTAVSVAADDPAFVYNFQHGGTWPDSFGLHGPISSPHFGYNDNYGRPGSWKAYANQPRNKPYSFGGGFHIVGKKGEIVHFYNSSGVPEATADGGATAWQDLNWPELASAMAADLPDHHNGIEFQGNLFWLNRHVGGYDAVSQKFRVFNWLGSILGFWEASNPIGPWTRVSTDSPIPSASNANYVWHAQFWHVPGVANKAYWTNGVTFNDPLMVTTNGCATWSRVDQGKTFTVTEVTTYGFSKSATPGGPPCILFHGRVDGVMGYHRTDDDFATKPTFLGTFLMNWIDSPLRIFGNMNKYHDFRVCYSGSGALRVEYEHRLSLAA